MMRNNVETQARMVLVFQMAKVASRSWFRALNTALPCSEIVHFHAISNMSVNRVQYNVSKKGEGQTVKYMSFPRLGCPPDSIKHFVDDGVWKGPAVDIITGVRDPVARAVSVVAFLSNRLGYTSQPVTVRDGGSPEALRDLFFTVLRAAQEQTQQNDTLVNILAHALYDYRRWFQEELHPSFGIDVMQEDFSFDLAALRKDSTHRLLVYRVEDLLHPERETKLLNTASDFLGHKLEKIPPDFTEGEARFRLFYKQFKHSIKLSEEDLDWFYNCETVEKFYTSQEVTEFRAKWMEKAI